MKGSRVKTEKEEYNHSPARTRKGSRARTGNEEDNHSLAGKEAENHSPVGKEAENHSPADTQGGREPLASRHARRKTTTHQQERAP